MQFCQLLLAIIFLRTAASAASIQARKHDPKLGICGEQKYSYEDYTCYGHKLCPIQKEPVYKVSYPCGNDCYYVDEYICHGDKMCPTPAAPEICEGPDGKWACYDPLKYQCLNCKLEPL